jgi:hypothetical protein
MTALVVVVLDKSFDLVFEVTGQEVIFQQDAIFQGLMPALDLALCHLAFKLKDRTTLQHSI